MPESSGHNNKTDAPLKTRRETFVEKLVRRTLTSVGGVFDRLAGRSRKKNDLPSTGDLSERLKRLIDGGARLAPDKRKIAPHYIRLKYAWGQASEDFLNALNRLQQELLVVAIDHINDNRYQTLAPVKVETKADILTTGFALSVGFDAGDAANREQVEVPAEIFAALFQTESEAAPLKLVIAATATFNLPGRDPREVELIFAPDDKTHLTVGRSKENELFLDDASVSKHHASLVMTEAGVLRVADTGSTNGTFLNGERIAYGKAYDVTPQDKVGFGSVGVNFNWEMPKPPEIVAEKPADADDFNYQNDFGMKQPDHQIKVDSAETFVEDVDSETDRSEPGEPETVFGSFDEPETAVGKFIPEPATVTGKSAPEAARGDDGANEPETVFADSIELKENAPAAQTIGARPASNDFDDSMNEFSPARKSPDDSHRRDQ